MFLHIFQSKSNSHFQRLKCSYNSFMVNNFKTHRSWLIIYLPFNCITWSTHDGFL